MKKYLILLLIVGMLQFQCGGGKQVALTAPVGDNILIMGGILVENLTFSSLGRYETIESGIDLVVLGKSEKGGEIKGYQIVSDNSGYFYLENVPRGQYIIKGAKAILEDQSEVRFMNDWQDNRIRFYRLVRPEQTIDFSAVYFPKQEMQGKILNIGIGYFGLEPGSISYKTLTELKNQKLGTEKVHNRLNPLDYFKSKFPDSAWFK